MEIFEFLILKKIKFFYQIVNKLFSFINLTTVFLPPEFAMLSSIESDSSFFSFPELSIRGCKRKSFAFYV